MSYVYIRSRSEPLYTVGFYDPGGNWQPESDHESSDEAAARARWLNGGSNPKPEGYGTIRTLADAACVIKEAFERLGCHVATLTRNGKELTVELCDGDIARVSIAEYETAQEHSDRMHREAFEATDPMRHYPEPQYDSEDY